MPPAEKFGTGKLPCFGNDPHQLIRRLMVLGGGKKLFLAHHGQLTHFFNYLPHMLDRVDHITGPGLALRANHGRAFGNAPQSLA